MSIAEILRQVNWVDIIVIILLIRTTYTGLRNGFLSEVFKAVGLIINLFISIRYYQDFARFLTQQFFFFKFSLSINEGISFIFLLVLIMLIFKILHFITKFIMNVEATGVLEKIGGMAAGFVRGGILASLILFALNLLPVEYLNKSINEDSLTGPYLLRVGPRIYHAVAKIIPQVNSEEKRNN